MPRFTPAEECALDRARGVAQGCEACASGAPGATHTCKRDTGAACEWCGTSAPNELGELVLNTDGGAPYHAGCEAGSMAGTPADGDLPTCRVCHTEIVEPTLASSDELWAFAARIGFVHTVTCRVEFWSRLAGAKAEQAARVLFPASREVPPADEAAAVRRIATEVEAFANQAGALYEAMQNAPVEVRGWLQRATELADGLAIELYAQLARVDRGVRR